MFKVIVREKMIDSQEITFEDLQRTAIRTEEVIDSRPVIVYRLGDNDVSVPLLGRRSEDGDIYYSLMVLCSAPPVVSIN